MGHEIDLILTLTGGLTAALILGFVTHRLRLSPIVGYILAGVVVGPFTPGFVAHGALAQQLAEIGVILLMFGVGLNLDARELLAVRRIAVPGAIAGIVVAWVLGFLIARAFGWTLRAQILFGLTISVSSTVVLLRVLADRDLLHTPVGHIGVGWLVLEDLFTVVTLVMIPIVAGGHAATSTLGVFSAVGLALLKIALLVVFTLTAGKKLLPIVLGYVARTRSRELFTLTVLVLALGIAVGSAELFGVSMALGAFLAGMIVGQSEFSSRAASEALPMRDAFAVLFFVSVGMMFDPRSVVPNAPMIGATIAVIVFGKPLAAYFVGRVLRYPPRTAIPLAASLAQIGEFSFIVAGVGRSIGVLPANAIQVIVASSIACITLDPLFVRAAERVARTLSDGARSRSQLAAGETVDPDAEPKHRAIVVGYGPIGRTLTRLLKENGLEPIVIELNHESVRALARAGIAAVYGDASQREILERAGVREAGSLIFAASGTPAEAVIRTAKDLNPKLQILARSNYVRDVAKAVEAGAHVVVAAEVEVALAMTEHLLEQLGASAEQLDRARERVRRELRGT